MGSGNEIAQGEVHSRSRISKLKYDGMRHATLINEKALDKRKGAR